VPSTHVHYDKQGRVEVPGRRILRIVLIVVAVGLGLDHRRIYGYRSRASQRRRLELQVNAHLASSLLTRAAERYLKHTAS
jgi:hypothetical protein